MTSDAARRYLLVLWLGAIGIQVANQVTYAYQQSGAPTVGATTVGPVPVVTPQCSTDYLVSPHKFVAAAIVFSGLFGLAEWMPGLAVAIATGVDVLALLGPLVAGGGTGNTLFDKITGLVKASA